MAEIYHRLNFDKGLSEAFEAYQPQNELSLDKTIYEYAPKLKERLPSMRGKLLQDNGIPHPEHLKVIDALDRNFLFPGYQQYFSDLVPRERIVLAHNDG